MSADVKVSTAVGICLATGVTAIPDILLNGLGKLAFAVVTAIITGFVHHAATRVAQSLGDKLKRRSDKGNPPKLG